MIPVNVKVDFIKIGKSTGLSINYNLSENWGILGFGISAGLCYTSSLEEESIPYNLWINPFSFNISYITNFQGPFYLLINASLGYTFYHFRYPEGSIEPNSGMNFFLSPVIGAGFYLLKKISLRISFNYTITFFEESQFYSIIPEIGIFYNFF